MDLRRQALYWAQIIRKGRIMILCVCMMYVQEKERKRERERERENEKAQLLYLEFVGTLNHCTRAMDGPSILQSMFFTVILSCCLLGMLQARHTSAVLIGNIIHGIKKVSLLERCGRIFGLGLLNKISDKANGI